MYKKSLLSLCLCLAYLWTWIMSDISVEAITIDSQEISLHTCSIHDNEQMGLCIQQMIINSSQLHSNIFNNNELADDALTNFEHSQLTNFFEFLLEQFNAS